MAQGGSPSGHRCTRGGYPPLVWMGIRTSNMDNRRHHRNASAPQRSGRPRQYDRHPIHLHAQNRVRQGARAGKRRFLVVVEAQQRPRLQRRPDRAGSQHGSDPHVESVALHALLLVPHAIAIGSAGSWPWWSVRTIIFYGLSVVLWLSYFYAFFRLRRSSAPLSDRNPDRQ